MEVAAKLSRAQLSAYKARLVIDQIRGKYVEEALDILAFSQKKAAKIVKKLLESAIANAEQNNGLDVDRLFVSEAKADAGMTLKRFRPKGMGRMRKRFHRHSHLTVSVSERG